MAKTTRKRSTNQSDPDHSPGPSIAVIDDLPPYPTPDDDEDGPDGIDILQDPILGNTDPETGEPEAIVVLGQSQEPEPALTMTQAMANAAAFVDSIDDPPKKQPTRQDYVDSVGRSGKKQPETGPKLTKTNSAVLLPTPPYRNFNSDSPRKEQRPPAFFDWKNRLPEWVKKSGMFYVYRLHPILKLVDDKELKNVGQIPGEEEVDEDMILNRFGCGDYRIIFTVSPGPGAMATLWLKGIGGGDYKNHPPTDERISDPNNVDWSNPNNKSYEGFLRSTGRHPDSLAAKERETDMATIQVVEKLAEQNSGLLDRVMDMATKNMERDNDRPLNLDASAMSNAMEVVTDGAKRSNAMMQETIATIQKLKSENAGSNTDPVAMFTSIMDLMEKMGFGKKDSGTSLEVLALMDEVKALRKEASEARGQQMQMLMDEVKVLRAAPAPGSTASLVEQFKALREVKDLLAEDDDGVEDAVKGAAGSMAPKWLQPYLPIAEALVTGYFKSQQPQQPGQVQGQALPANWQPLRPGQNPMGQVPMQQLSAPVSPTVTGPVPVPSPTAQSPADQSAQSTTQPGMDPQITHFITLMSPGLLSNLRAGKSGIEFTDLFMDWFEQDTYDQLMGYGFSEEVITQALLTHPTLGPQLAQANQTLAPGALTKFVHEFMHYYEITEKDMGNAPGPVAVPSSGTGGVGGGGLAS